MKTNSTRYAFRADASLTSGTGHIMRCMTLANALRAAGAECCFICREHPGHLMELIRRRGFVTYPLPVTPAGGNREHDCRLGSDWSGDAGETTAILAEIDPDWLIVDHYAIDSRWESQVRSQTDQLMVIEDLPERAHYCDVLLDQTFGRVAADYRAWVSSECTVLAGSAYALLRSEFAALRQYSLERRRSARCRRVLISMGGFDQANVTMRVLECLRDVPLPPECTLTVVLRSEAPWLREVRLYARDLPWQTEVLVDVADMATLIADSDFGIGAAGSTSWERCALGLPSFLVVSAENQRDVAAALSRARAAYSAEVAEIPEALPLAMREQVFSADAALRMSEAASKVTDGNGVGRVLRYLDPSGHA